MFSIRGQMDPTGTAIDWENGARWTRVTVGAGAVSTGRQPQHSDACPSLSCFGACKSPHTTDALRGLLSDVTIGCAEFTNGEVGIIRGPCAQPVCKEGEVVRERECKDANATRGHWDVFGFRVKLVTGLLQEAVPSCPGTRLALIDLTDYDPRHHGRFFRNATAMHELGRNCAASLTWEAEGEVPRGRAPLPEQPIMIPDAYFLMTRGYHRTSKYFEKAGVDETKEAIARNNLESPWASKHFSVVWRGTDTSDVSGDRKRLVERAAELRKEGRFSKAQLDIFFSEKFFQSGDNRSYLTIPQMIESRGIVSVDGIGNEWTLVWKLMSNSVVLLVESRRVWQWYFPQMLPWKHYVPVRNDLSDLKDSVQFVLDPANDAKLTAIAQASTELALSLEMKTEARLLRNRLAGSFRCPRR